MLFLFLFEEIMTQAWWFNSHDFIMHATDLNFRSQRGPQFSQSWRKVLEEKDCNCGLDVTVSWSDLGQITSECGHLLQRKGCSVGVCVSVGKCFGGACVRACKCFGATWVRGCMCASERMREEEKERERERERSKVQKNNNSKLTFRFELYISLWEKISEQHFWRHWGRIGRF